MLCVFIFRRTGGASKGLRWIFSGKEAGSRVGGTQNLDNPTRLWRIATENTSSLASRSTPLFIGSKVKGAGVGAGAGDKDGPQSRVTAGWASATRGIRDYVIRCHINLGSHVCCVFYFFVRGKKKKTPLISCVGGLSSGFLLGHRHQP